MPKTPVDWAEGPGRAAVLVQERSCKACREPVAGLVLVAELEDGEAFLSAEPGIGGLSRKGLANQVAEYLRQVGAELSHGGFRICETPDGRRRAQACARCGAAIWEFALEDECFADLSQDLNELRGFWVDKAAVLTAGSRKVRLESATWARLPKCLLP